MLLARLADDFLDFSQRRFGKKNFVIPASIGLGAVLPGDLFGGLRVVFPR
jgi:hypothetical protein